MLKGTVKWFSQEKGYGFIFSDDSAKDHYFNVKDVIGNDLPNTGDIVGFDSTSSPKGLRAKNVNILLKTSAEKNSVRSQANKNPRNDKITCHSCGKSIVPKVVFYQGRVDKAMCPFCLATIKRNWCYITTAYTKYLGKDDDCYELNLLRSFRDNYVASLPAGLKIISEYYELAPQILTALYASSKKGTIFKEIIIPTLDKCVVLIENNQFSKAYSSYQELVLRLKKLLLKSTAEC